MHMTSSRKTIYAVAMVLVFFGVLELSLRVVGFSDHADDTRFVLNPEWDYPEIFLKDHELFWKFRPDQVIASGFFVEGEYHINRHGLRGPDFSPQKSPGTYRIICLGNSCTFGWRVGESDVYPRRLEAILDESAPDGSWEVINAGVTGYSSLQGLRFLRREVLKWEPNLLIFNYCWNDHWAGAQDIADKDQQLPAQWVLNIQNLLGRTFTYRLVKYLVFSIKKPTPADFSRTNPVYRVGLEDFRKNLSGMIATARGHDIPLVLLTAPITARADRKYAGVHAYHGRYNDIIRSFAGTDGVTILDAAAEFAGRNGLFDNPERDIKHYNSNGHKIIAEIIADHVASPHGGI
jgi:lysophospholipase L1-like esterase